MAKESGKKESKGEFDMVSFRLARKYYEQLEALAKNWHDDESGTLLTASLVARKLLIKALEDPSKKKS
jgi:hypothetical protein